MALKDSAAQSALSLGGQTPATTNASPSGDQGIITLEGSTLDRDNGATPTRYLDNPPS
jgi:hypothetical protein